MDRRELLALIGGAAALAPFEPGIMPLYGYARASALDPDLSTQRAALKAAGCEVIRAEKASGARRRLPALLNSLRSGDTLVVTRIDRLARSLKDLQDIVHEFAGRGVALKATEQPVDTGTDIGGGKAFLDMLGVFVEFKTSLRRERQLEGISAAKARGVYVGRKPSIDAGEILRLRRDEKLGPAAIARRLGIGRASVYRLLGERSATSRERIIAWANSPSADIDERGLRRLRAEPMRAVERTPSHLDRVLAETTGVGKIPEPERQPR